MKSKIWVQDGTGFWWGDVPTLHKTLPIGVYELVMKGGLEPALMLNKQSDTFELPEHLFGLERDFITRVKSTFQARQSNLGVLLKGLKGTGKTVTSKVLCNELKIPVILINKAYSDIGGFINSINQDLILLFDEFEKTYDLHRYSYNDEDGGPKHNQSIVSLLTLMDGVLTTTHRRLFLMTTNEAWLPDPMLSRPSRIRYIKDFTDLSYDTIREILEYTLNDKSKLDDALELMKTLEIITIDIVKTIGEEINIHGRTDATFFKDFNLKHHEERLEWYIETNKGEVVIKDNPNFLFEHIEPQNWLRVNRQDARIEKILEIDSTLQKARIQVITMTSKPETLVLGCRPLQKVHSSLAF